MKKRKITRKTLDELAKSMPVLTEQEQRECVGGTYFYDLNGHFIGKYGTTDTLRFISKEEYDYKSSNFGSAPPDNWGSSLSDLGSTERYTIVHNMLKDNFNVDVIVGPIKSGNVSEVMGFLPNGVLGIRPDNSTIFTNYNAFMSTLQHEADHYNSSFYSSGMAGSGNNEGAIKTEEFRVYENQVKSQFFKNAPYDYKYRTAVGWIDLLDDSDNMIAMRKYIAVACGLPENTFTYGL